MRLLALTLVAAAVTAASIAAVLSGAESEARPSGCKAQPRHGEPKLDRRLDRGRDASFLDDYDPETLYYALPPDSIRAIDHPCHEDPAAADALLPASSQVIGVERRGDARAYPVDLIALHEVVNDVVGGACGASSWAVRSPAVSAGRGCGG
jgi:hypothetical protein